MIKRKVLDGLPVGSTIYEMNDTFARITKLEIIKIKNELYLFDEHGESIQPIRYAFGCEDYYLSQRLANGALKALRKRIDAMDDLSCKPEITK